MGCGGSSLKGDFNADIGGSSSAPKGRRQPRGDSYLAGLDTSSEIKPTRSLSHGAYNTTTSDSTSGPTVRKQSYNPFSPSSDKPTTTSSAEIHKDRHLSHGAYNTTAYDETATSPPLSPQMTRQKSYPYNTGLPGSSEIHKERSLAHGAYNTTTYDTTATSPYEPYQRPSYVAADTSSEIKQSSRWFGGNVESTRTSAIGMLGGKEGDKRNRGDLGDNGMGIGLAGGGNKRSYGDDEVKRVLGMSRQELMRKMEAQQSAMQGGRSTMVY